MKTIFGGAALAESATTDETNSERKYRMAASVSGEVPAMIAGRKREDRGQTEGRKRKRRARSVGPSLTLPALKSALWLLSLLLESHEGGFCFPAGWAADLRDLFQNTFGLIGSDLFESLHRTVEAKCIARHSARWERYTLRIELIQYLARTVAEFGII